MKLGIVLLLRLKKENKCERLSKSIASFDYFDKSLIVIFIITGSNSIALCATIIGATVGIVSTSFSLAFFIFTGIIKKLLKTRRKNIIKLLC